MTIEMINYSTRQAMEIDNQIRSGNGWRALHRDFINNDESQGYRVTFVNGIDDPIAPPDPERDRAIQLADKLDTDGLLSTVELNEFVKLKLVRGK